MFIKTINRFVTANIYLIVQWYLKNCHSTATRRRWGFSVSLRHGSENWILPPAITLQARCVCVDSSWILRDGFECLLIKIQNYRNLFVFGIILLMLFCNINGIYSNHIFCWYHHFFNRIILLEFFYLCIDHYIVRSAF